jgi:hypothetical protein
MRVSRLSSLVDSYQLYNATMPAHVFPQGVKRRTMRIPNNVTKALLPSFVTVEEWGPAIVADWLSL